MNLVRNILAVAIVLLIIGLLGYVFFKNNTTLPPLSDVIPEESTLVSIDAEKQPSPTVEQVQQEYPCFPNNVLPLCTTLTGRYELVTADEFTFLSFRADGASVIKIPYVTTPDSPPQFRFPDVEFSNHAEAADLLKISCSSRGTAEIVVTGYQYQGQESSPSTKLIEVLKLTPEKSGC
jgi:hypothetical protein